MNEEQPGEKKHEDALEHREGIYPERRLFENLLTLISARGLKA
jgi:hypothetical protein